MAGPLDSQVGLKVESTYGTAVTVDTFYEWDQERSSHNPGTTSLQGTGVQPGSASAPRADRRGAGVATPNGVLALDLQSKGMGKLFQLAMGSSESNLVGGTTYQQLHTVTLTGSTLPSATVQYGIVRSDTAGTADAYTYEGVTFHQWELAQATNDIAKLAFTWDAEALATATALASASYPSLSAPFNGRHASMTIGGTITVPTTTATAGLGSATAATNVRDFTLSVDSQANLDRFRFGGRNQPRVALRSMTISCVVEYDGTTLRDAIINQTSLPVSMTWADTGQALSTGYATVQVIAPACVPQSSDLPAPGADPVYNVTFDVLQPSSGAALYVAIRTSDTAL